MVSLNQRWKDGDVVYSGYLQKKGSKVKSWKNRWFELRTDGTLSYAKSRGSKPIGVFHLHPSHTSIQLVHQYNQVAQLGLTYKTFETVVQPEMIDGGGSGSGSGIQLQQQQQVNSGQGGVKLDISRVFASYKRKYRSDMSDYLSSNSESHNDGSHNGNGGGGGGGNNNSNNSSSGGVDDQSSSSSSSGGKSAMSNNPSVGKNQNNAGNNNTNNADLPSVSLFHTSSGARKARSNRKSVLRSNLVEKFQPLKQITKSGTELHKYFKFAILTVDHESGETSESRKFNASSEVDRLKWISAIEKVLLYLTEKERAKRSNALLSLVQRQGLFASLEDYAPFVERFFTDASLLLNTVNSILKVEEDEVVALIVLSDKFNHHQSQQVMMNSSSNSSGNSNSGSGGNNHYSMYRQQSLRLCAVAIVDELNNSIDQGTLFRRNSVSTRFVTVYFKIHGLSFLQTMLAQPLLKIVIEDCDYEIELSRIVDSLAVSSPSMTQQEMEKEAKRIQASHFDQLRQCALRFLQGITSFSLSHCPHELRMVMRIMYEEGEKRWNCGAMCVGALFFLRFVCPAIISPHLFNICQMPPKRNAQRTLVLLTKVIQNISNSVVSSKKEPYMALFTDFIREMSQPLKDFETELANVSLSSQQVATTAATTASNNSTTTTGGTSVNSSDDSKQFIDDSLTLQCLHLSHQLFRKSSTNSTFNSPDPNVVQYYDQILDSLKISNNNKRPPVSPSGRQSSADLDSSNRSSTSSNRLSVSSRSSTDSTDGTPRSTPTTRARSKNVVPFQLPSFHASFTGNSAQDTPSSTTTQQISTPTTSTSSSPSNSSTPTTTTVDSSTVQESVQEVQDTAATGTTTKANPSVAKIVAIDSTTRKRSFGWDFSDKDKASSQILASINACVGSVLLDTNTQLLNKSLHVYSFDMFDESPESNAVYLSTSNIQGAMRQLSSALYAFVRMNIKDAWSQIEDLVSSQPQLSHFMFEITTLISSDDPLLVEELRFCQLLLIALHYDQFLVTVKTIFSLLDKSLDDRMKKRKKKILDTIAIPNWSCYQISNR